MEGWGDFLVAQVGASAALLGLIFVGISLNLEKILTHAALPDRALIALALLFAILLSCSLLLMPGQSLTIVGAEVLAIGVLAWLFTTLLEVRTLRGLEGVFLRKYISSFVMAQLSTIPYIVAGLMLVSGQEAGLYGLAAAIIVSLIKAVTDAWVLLVEINR